jgi:hypothetical protein
MLNRHSGAQLETFKQNITNFQQHTIPEKVAKRLELIHDVFNRIMKVVDAGALPISPDAPLGTQDIIDLAAKFNHDFICDFIFQGLAENKEFITKCKTLGAEPGNVVEMLKNAVSPKYAIYKYPAGQNRYGFGNNEWQYSLNDYFKVTQASWKQPGNDQGLAGINNDLINIIKGFMEKRVNDFYREYITPLNDCMDSIEVLQIAQQELEGLGNPAIDELDFDALRTRSDSLRRIFEKLKPENDTSLADRVDRASNNKHFGQEIKIAGFAGIPQFIGARIKPAVLSADGATAGLANQQRNPAVLAAPNSN